MAEDGSEFDPRVVVFIFIQLTMKAAMKLWGNKTTVATEKEMKQFWHKSFQPVCWTDLTPEQQCTMHESHIFVQKKQTDELKARIVARRNRKKMPPTIATESVLLSCVSMQERNKM